jgi:ergothioneine biosynthesis protein EgtB
VGPAYVELDVVAAIDPGPMGWIDVAGGVVEIGVDVGDLPFSWDNESPRHEVRVYDVALADRLVTAGEWCAFIEDGGYLRPELWKSDGWHRRQLEQWTAPEYWRRDPDDSDRWLLHTLTGVRPLDQFEPVVHVSQYEADAYATWLGVRLPTEFEWEHAARDIAVEGNFLDDTDCLHPRAAGPPTGSVRQLFGDCWEWTSSAYQPYPGFRIADGALGEYNGKFMSGQHVLRGGSVLTPPGHARATYRNFFHPHTRWHASGVRLATDRTS